MDRRDIVLHYPNMPKPIPTFALYGETDSRHDWLHWETIRSRSRLHNYRIAAHRHEQFFQVLYLTRGSVVKHIATGDQRPLAAGQLPYQTYAVPVHVVPGERVQVTFTVPETPGDYPFLCTFAGHYQAGMKGTLIVRADTRRYTDASLGRTPERGQ